MKRTIGAAMLIMAGFSLNPVTAALTNDVNIDVSASESQWWSTYQVEVKNTSSQAIDMRSSVLELVLPHATTDIQFSSQGLSYPSQNIEHETTKDGVLHKVTFSFDNGAWVKDELLSDTAFFLSFGINGQLPDLVSFENSIKFNGEGGETPPVPEVQLSILSPFEGQRLVTNQITEIQGSVEGEAASKLEFWVNNLKIADQPVDQDVTNYSQTWTPNELGESAIHVLVFDSSDQQIEQKTLKVNIESDQDFSAPEVSFISPEDGATFKKTETVSISVDAFDAEDDLSTVVIKSDNASVCEFDATKVDQFSCDWQPDKAGTVVLDAVAMDEQNLSATASVQITITESSNSCGDVPQYQDGVNYQVGDLVSNAGEMFSCTVFGWCGNPVWTPGTGHPNYPDAWKDAWETEGQCDPNVAPEIELISPENGDRLQPNQSFDVIVDAFDEDGEIVKVEALLKSTVMATSTELTPDGNYLLEIPGQVEGSYELVTTAYDDKGASTATKPITLAITDRDLAVGLTSPIDGSSFTQGRSIKLVAEAQSFVGDIKSVTFLVNDVELTTITQAPYEFEWLGAQLGTHTIEAIALNTVGDTQTTPTSTIEVKEPTFDTGLRDNPDRSISYLTSWGLTDIEELNNSNGDAYFLSFGNWDANGNIKVSDDMITPKYDPSWMAPGYQSWTELKHSHDNKTMMVAFGGASDERIWSLMGSEQSREAIANGLVEMMSQPYPVYKKNLSPDEIVGECLATDWQGNCDYTKYQLAGYVSIDGVDFDYETAARLTEKQNRELEDIINRIRDKIGLSKILSLTTYHVGADPVECANPNVYENCSFIESDRSAHHGEVISLLQNTRDTIDFYNVMAYDAGENFKYDVAMANYAYHVQDPTKIVLGATINSQWGPNGRFVETYENNIERARWQKANGYGGFFIWTLGSNNQSLTLQEQVDYFNDMIEQN
ncbi:Ig-like domain-containing protein [Vibrio gigantis]|uniref:GH18 domain-containing protein n=1 Tax=Vibrio gigantis TaxID=296199 RepID=A0A5M9P6I3_9VIBR|nr:Ig-like domain-containing protein [Vibrio gigantis]KAA8681651.1 hypothetical protein F4W18_03590 [Vibrio gigantis]